MYTRKKPVLIGVVTYSAILILGLGVKACGSSSQVVETPSKGSSVKTVGFARVKKESAQSGEKSSVEKAPPPSLRGSPADFRSRLLSLRLETLATQIAVLEREFLDYLKSAKADEVKSAIDSLDNPAIKAAVILVLGRTNKALLRELGPEWLANKDYMIKVSTAHALAIRRYDSSVGHDTQVSGWNERIHWLNAALAKNLPPPLHVLSLDVAAIDGSEERAILLALVDSEPSALMRLTYLRMLAPSAVHSDVASKLEGYLQNSDDWELRAHSALALRSSSQTSSTDALIAAAKSDSNSKVRSESIKSLGQPTNDRAYAFLVSISESQLQAGETRSLVTALAQFPKDSAVDMIVAVARRTEHHAAVVEAVTQLSTRKDDKAFDAIVSIMIENKMGYVQIAAARKLLEKYGSRATDPIKSLISSTPYPAVAEEARKLIAK